MDNNNQTSQPSAQLPKPEEYLSQPSPAHKWIKLIMILVIVILIATIGTIIYQTYQANQQVEEVPIPKALIKEISPTIAVTELPGWKYYTDGVEKYSFQYLVDWYLDKGNPNQIFNYDVSKEPGRSFDGELDKDKIKIEIYSTVEPYSKSIEEYLIENPPTRYAEPANYNFEPIVIDNQKAMKAVDIWNGLTTLIIYIKNPSTGRIHQISAMPRYDLRSKVIDQILSTFQFTE